MVHDLEIKQVSKPFYFRILACFCSVLICCLVCFCGFAVPKVSAQSVLDQWEDYTDEYFGEGASFTIEEMSELTGGTPAFIFLYALSHLPYTMDEGCPLESLSSIQGYYYHNGKHVCQSLIKSGEYSNSNLQTLCYSDEFTIKPWVTGTTVNKVIGAVNSGNQSAQIYFQTQSPMANHIDGDGTIFPSTYLESGSVGIACFCYYGSVIPTLSDNSSTSDYFWWGSRFSASGHNYVAGGFENPYLNYGTYVSGLGLDPTFELSSDNVVDYVVDVYNPVIIEMYPQLVKYLFVPDETPTETTLPTSCGCHVDVYVEPTINVEVNVENQLPSDWLETIPEESTDNPLDELPTLEVENFTDVLQEPDDIVGENSGFWWVCLKAWIVDNDKVWKYLLGLFTIAVIGAILRRLG